LFKVFNSSSTKMACASGSIKFTAELLHLLQMEFYQITWSVCFFICIIKGWSNEIYEHSRYINSKAKTICIYTSSIRVGSEFTPRTGILSSNEWLACRRVPSPPTVTTRSTSLMGGDKLLRSTAFHSTDFFCRIAWQKFIASWWTLRLFSKNCTICNFPDRIQISNCSINIYNHAKHPCNKYKPKILEAPIRM